MGWVRLHPYNISQKVEIVVEHFRQHVAPLLNGTAKAMVVVGRRLEAVRWKLAIDKYIKSRGYTIRTLVAFSGEVTDNESGPDPFTENSKELNPNLRGRDIREAFKGDEYQILLVANKFQTGFDQPLLCGMYVDKRLAGIQSVQTLSRLNRAHPGKDTTYVLDFVNNAEDVLAAFKEILNAVMSALEAHTTMSTQALNSETVREGLKDVLLGPAEIYKALRIARRAPVRGPAVEPRHGAAGRPSRPAVPRRPASRSSW